MNASFANARGHEKPFALITGASSGLGAEFARQLAERGLDLVLVARRRDRLESLKKEIESKQPGRQVVVLAMDLTARESGAALKSATSGLRIDCLVNNAGFGTSGEFVDLPLERELEEIDLNVRALVELTHHFVRGMKDRHQGRIINVSSTAGFQPGPYMATYFATKAFVNSFTEALSFELQGSGVSCTALCPGPVDTEFAEVAGVKNARLFTAQAPSDAPAVVRFALDQAWRGETYAVHGITFRSMIFALRFVPRSVVRRVVAGLTKR